MSFLSPILMPQLLRAPTKAAAGSRLKSWRLESECFNQNVFSCSSSGLHIGVLRSEYALYPADVSNSYTADACSVTSTRSATFSARSVCCMPRSTANSAPSASILMKDGGGTVSFVANSSNVVQSTSTTDLVICPHMPAFVRLSSNLE
jgi:hypothetical protein